MENKDEIKKIMQFYYNFSMIFFNIIGFILAFLISIIFLTFADFTYNDLREYTYRREIKLENKKIGNINIYAYKNIKDNKVIEGIAKINDLYLPFYFEIFSGNFDSYEKIYDLFTGYKYDIKDYKLLNFEEAINLYKLDCIDKFKFSDHFCKKNIEYFVKNSHVFSFDIDFFNKLKKYDEKLACNMIKSYIENGIFIENLSKIGNSCGKEYYNIINSYLFLEKLKRNIFDINNINKEVDDFKIINMQYYFYLRNFEYSILDNIDFYLDFIISYINNYDDIKIFNLIYYYNNNILKPKISLISNEKIKKIIEKIDSINNGTYPGLIKDISKHIDSKFKKEVNVKEVFYIKSLEEEFKNYLNNFKNISLLKVDKENDKIKALISIEDKKYNIIVEYNPINNIFVIIDIDDLILKNKIKEKGYILFSDIKIEKNNTYINNTYTNNTDICSNLKLNNNFNIETCDSDIIKISNNEGIYYTLYVEDTIKLETNNEFYKGKKEFNITIEKIPSLLVSLSNQEYKERIGKNELILIEEKFSKYFKIKPKIELKNGKYNVIFNIGDYIFEGIFNLDNYKLTLKNIIYKSNKVKIRKKIIFYLTDNDITKINSFLLDPLTYIQNIDAKAVEKLK